jgi:NTE family protein
MSSKEITEVIADTDWEALFNDEPPRSDIPYRRKQDDRSALLPLEVGVGSGVPFASGVVAGQKVNFLFRSHTLAVTDIEDFDDLPTPFRAVASDIVAGRKAVLARGSLADAMRASMAIPGVFSPVVMDDMALIDGGIDQNLPVETVRGMGADVVIAVDIGTPLKQTTVAAEQGILKVMSRMLDILTKRNVGDSRAALGPADIYIQPDLGTITTASFQRMLEGAAAGETAARRQLEALSRLSVSEEEYAAYLRTRAERRRRGVGDLVIDEIRATGLSRVSPKLVLGRIRTKVGEPLDVATLQSDLTNVYKVGEFEKVDFRIERDGELRRLNIACEEKSWGPRYLRFGMSIESGLGGEADWTALVNLRYACINRLGAEWRTVATMGDQLGVETEFYQPVTFSGGVFVAPSFKYLSDQKGVFLADGSQAVVDIRSRVARFDVGVALGSVGEVRTGYAGGAVNATNSFVPEATEYRADVGAWVSELTLDRFDDADFPRHGTLLHARMDVSRQDLGADDDYDKLATAVSFAGTRAENTLFVKLEQGSSLGTEIPFHDQFRLGGFMRLAGLERGQIQDNAMAHAVLGLYRRMGTLPKLLGKGLYAGAAAETGQGWDRESDMRLADLRLSGSLFVGVETILGPIYVGYGQADQGESSPFFFLGRLF